MYATSNTVLISGDAKELAAIASGTLRPGYLVEPTGTGRQWVAQSQAGAQVAAAFVREQFENNGSGIEDTIASGDDCTVLLVEKGAIVNCITNLTIARGTLVGAHTDGTVKAADSEHAIGIAIEATYDHGALLRVPVLIF